jgi:predicted  nucleic acid-binding Zn-ribbon protein
MSDYLQRLEVLREKKAKVNAELAVAQKQLDEAIAALKELGEDMDQDIEALKAKIDAKIAAFEKAVDEAEVDLNGVS